MQINDVTDLMWLGIPAKKEEKESELNNHEQKFVESILQIQHNEFVQKIITQREQLTEHDKLQLYQKWANTIRASVKRSPAFMFANRSLESFLPTTDTLRKNTFDMFTPLVRSMVHMGILSKPEGLTDQQVHQNIQKDAQGAKMQIRIIEWACAVIPYMRPALPMIRTIKPWIYMATDAQERILHAVNHALEKDKLIAHTQHEVYENLNTM